MRIAGQALVYAAFAALIGYFSFSPDYTHLEPGLAVVKLSFSHGAARKGGCRRRTPEEIAAMPPNMRSPSDCPRERVPVVVELRLDGTLLYRDSLRAAGLASDGPATLYRRFEVPAGSHHLAARLRDSERDEGFDYETEADVELSPGESFVIDFRAETGGFRLLDS